MDVGGHHAGHGRAVVSDLYHALTGDPLSVLDLTCLLAAVPGTILLDVITGFPVVPPRSAPGRRQGGQGN